VAKVPLLRMEIVKRRSDMKGFVIFAAPLGGTLATFVTLPRPACPQVAYQGVG
jgi:hypothetical protein